MPWATAGHTCLLSTTGLVDVPKWFPTDEYQTGDEFLDARHSTPTGCRHRPRRARQQQMRVAGDAAWMRTGCRRLRRQHTHEPSGGLGWLHGAVRRARPAGQSPGLLELVRYPIRPRADGSREHRGGDRPSLRHAPGEYAANRGCRPFGRRQHGGSAGTQLSTAVCCSRHALRSRTGVGEVFRDRPCRHAWPHSL